MEMLIRNCHLLQALCGQWWTESTAQRRYWLIANGKEPQNLTNSWWLQLEKCLSEFCKSCRKRPSLPMLETWLFSAYESS